MQPLHVNQIAVLIQFELTVTAVENGAVAVYQTEETVLANRDIQATPGVGGSAVGKVLGNPGDFNAQAHFGAREHISKRRRTGFKPVGGGVGDVITNNIEVGRCCVQTADRLRKGHDLLLISVKA